MQILKHLFIILNKSISAKHYAQLGCNYVKNAWRKDKDIKQNDR